MRARKPKEGDWTEGQQACGPQTGGAGVNLRRRSTSVSVGERVCPEDRQTGESAGPKVRSFLWAGCRRPGFIWRSKATEALTGRTLLLVRLRGDTALEPGRTVRKP